MTNRVVVEDLGLGTLSEDLGRALNGILDRHADQVVGQMVVNIEQRGFVDTGATMDTMQVNPPNLPPRTDLERYIGPTTEYAIYGELGWERQTKNGAVHFAGLHFARDALMSVKDSFIAAIGAAMQKLGGR